jgi:hypothetical protein
MNKIALHHPASITVPHEALTLKNASARAKTASSDQPS